MSTFDGKAFGAEIVSVVKDFMRRQVEPMTARIDQLEARLRLVEAQAGTTKSKPVHRITAPSRIVRL